MGSRQEVKITNNGIERENKQQTKLVAIEAQRSP